MENQHPHSGILDLLRKIARLAADPNAMDGERQAAADKLRTLMQRHGLTEADLSDNTPHKFYLIPTTQNKLELDLALQIVGQILNISTVRHSCAKDGTLAEFYATPSQKADILDCWAHYLPLFRTTAKAMAAEQKRLRKQLRDLPKTTVSAFFHKFHIFPEIEGTEARRMPTADQIRRAMAIHQMAAEMSGEAWERKAGKLDQQTLLLA